MEKAAEMLRRIRNELGFDVWIFTYRGWPLPERYPARSKRQYIAAWNSEFWRSRFYLAP